MRHTRKELLGILRESCSALKEYLMTRKLHRIDILLAAAAGALLLVCWLFYMPISQVFSTTLDISMGYSAKQDGSGLYYVLDDGRTRLLCFDEEARVRYALVSPSDGKGRGNPAISDFAVDGGLTYLSISEWDGMLLSRELIAVYRGNHFVRTLTERDYSDLTVNKPRFYGIHVEDGILSYMECEENTLLLHRLSLEDGTEETERLFCNNAFNAVSDCAFYRNTAYAILKSGLLLSIENGSQKLVYSTRQPGEEDRIPYRLTVDRNGCPCFTDIRGGCAVRVNTVQQDVEVLTEHTVSQTLNFTWDGEGELYLEEDGLRVERGGESRWFLSLTKPALRIALQIAWLAVLAAFVLLTAVLVIRLAACFISRKYTVPQLVSFWVIGTVAGVSALLCGMLISNFSNLYRQQMMEQMNNSAVIVANQIPAGTISQIRRAEDFNGEAHRTLCQIMDRAFPKDVEFNRQLYCNILRLEEDGSACAVAYLDQSIGVYFPLEEVDAEEVREVYRFSGGLNVVWNSGVTDVSGTYLSVKVPVYENGSVSGVVSVGAETYVIQETITRMQVQILLSIIVIIMLIWLITSEIMAWFTNRSLYQRSVAEGEPSVLPGHLIRLQTFAVSACFNMTSTFLPVWLLRNSTVFPEASREFMASLPITVNIFVIGVMSLFTAALVWCLGMERIFILATACSFGGNLLIFLFPSYYTVFFGLLIDGIGVGLITNATYVLLTYIRDETNRQWSFTVYNAAYLSGVNFGMLLGSLLAVVLGQRAVFLVVVLTWLGLGLMGKALVKQLSGLIAAEAQGKTQMFGELEEAAGAAGETKLSTGRFLFNRPVMSFFVLVQNPYILFNSFVFYYVPLFCGNMGYDETIVSILIMLYSEVAVLSGDMLTQWVSKSLGNRGMYAAYAMNILALLVFACTNNLLGMVLALLLLGSAAAYGKTLQQTWFLKQKPVQRYGEDRAMGVYNFTENIGESLGPIVFARMMAQRPLLGAVAPFCAGIAALGCGHFALNRKELKET